MKDGDINKLPKWARQEIETLEMRLREAEVKLSFAMKPVQSGFKGASIRTPKRDGSPMGEQVMLPSDRITFHLVGDREILAGIRDDHLHINSQNRSLSILPRAANDFEVNLLIR